FADRRIHFCEWPVTWSEKAIDSQKRQMHFAISAQWACGTDEHRRIEETGCALFNESDHGIEVGIAASRCDCSCRRSVEPFRKRDRFFERVEAVAGQCTLRENGQLGRMIGSSLNVFDYLPSIHLDVADFHVHLKACDSRS